MKTILQTVKNAGTFKSLEAAIKLAGLEDILSKKGPFTIFAPSDKAFSKVPVDKMESLMKNKDQLSKMIVFHIIPGKLTANEISALKTTTTLEGQQLEIDASKGVDMKHPLVLKVNHAQVVKNDIECANGIIHIIDDVLFP